jgi:hypothetical protein
MVDLLRLTATAPDPAMLALPWDVPLDQWPQEVITALPRGISRHVVRFVGVSGRILAVKEIGESVANHEYEHLRALQRLGMPSVTPVGAVSCRRAPNGERLEAALVTEHLQFSLPYRALFSQELQPGTTIRLIDALAVLMVRLHLAGFAWGDVSLSNTLFRRDAEAFAAYLVDAETGQLHDDLSPGKRAYDLDVARVNIIGELMDLEAGGMLEADVDPIEFGDRLVERYESLWDALTGAESFGSTDLWRVTARIEQLNALGFDVAELDLAADPKGAVSIRPKVVEAGHHSRRLARLTGFSVQEKQAQRMLNDLDQYRAANGRRDQDEARVARDWIADVYEPALEAVPADQRGKLEPAQLFHEMLDHRWFVSSEQGRDVPMSEAASSYVDKVLRSLPNEQAVLGANARALTGLASAADQSDVDAKLDL